MSFIADVLLGAGALGAGYFCYVLSARLSAFTRLENGMGGAIAVLSVQVDDMTRAIDAAQQTAARSAQSLEDLTARAEEAARRLELLLATLHEMPDPAAEPRRTRVLHHGQRSRGGSAAEAA
jgi:outer membrane murein-binding lipoprotein Lpp